MNNSLTHNLTAWQAKPGNDARTAADALGLSSEQLHERMQGRTEWRWSEAVNLAALIGCSLGDLEEGGRADA